MRMAVHRPSNFVPPDPKQKKPRDREIQMVILLVVITVTFIISWTAHDVSRQSQYNIFLAKTKE